MAYGFFVFLLGFSPHIGFGIALPIIVLIFIGDAQAPEELRRRVLSVYNLDHGIMPLGSIGRGRTGRRVLSHNGADSSNGWRARPVSDDSNPRICLPSPLFSLGIKWYHASVPIEA